MRNNFMLQGATKLNKHEMRNVKGGASQCAPGEILYNCTVSYDGGGSFSGLACGRDPFHAAALTFIEHGEPGTTTTCVAR